VNDEIENFLIWLAVERGLSTNYQLSTRHSLETFAAWLPDHATPKFAALRSGSSLRMLKLCESVVSAKREHSCEDQSRNI
jgi:site-specific recombinase XerD